jgi:hypothetical protein
MHRNDAIIPFEPLASYIMSIKEEKEEEIYYTDTPTIGTVSLLHMTHRVG